MTDTTQTDRPLSGQQLSALQKAWETQLVATLRDTDLRKYAMGEAIRLTEHAVKGDPTRDVDPMAFAKAIYEFLTAPIGDIKITIG